MGSEQATTASDATPVGKSMETVDCTGTVRLDSKHSTAASTESAKSTDSPDNSLSPVPRLLQPNMKEEEGSEPIMRAALELAAAARAKAERALQMREEERAFKG